MEEASSRPGGWSRGLESVWLAAVVVAPLLFSPTGGDGFELHKVVVLRSLAIVAVALWAGRRLGGGESASGERARRGGEGTLAALAIANLVVLGIATAASVDPRSSLWGASTRHQGLLTEALYVLFFALVLRHLRSWRQMERLVDAAILASLPVALYGVIQRFGTDPLLWSDDVSSRVTSTLGNPIFLGAFLVLVVPLTLYRHVAVARVMSKGESALLKTVLLVGSSANLVFQIVAWSRGPVSGTAAAAVTVVFWRLQASLLGKAPSPSLRMGVYNAILSAQLAALLLSGSRGPLLGLAAGMGFFLLLWSVGTRRVRTAAALGALGAASVLLLVVANLDGTRVDIPDDVPTIGRLDQLFNRTGRVRLHIWEAAVRALAARPERALLGFGPETLQFVLPPYFTPEAGGGVRERGALPDRAHNESVERLLTSGAIGLAVAVSWMTVLLGLGLRAARLLSRGTLARYGALCCVGAAGAGLLSRALDGGWRLAAPSVMLGILCGALLYVGSAAVGRRAKGARRWSERRWLAVALASALVAHFVELQFGIGVTATRLYAWVFAAALAVAAGPRRLEDVPRNEERGLDASLVPLVLGTLVYAFLARPSVPAFPPSVFWLFSFTWLIGGLLVLAPRERSERGRAFAIYALVTLVPSLALAWAQRLWVDHGAGLAEPFWLFLLCWTVTAALARGARPRVRFRPGRAAAQACVIASALVLVFGPVLEPVRADALLGEARAHRSRGDLDAAERFARRAVERQPREIYLLELGRILFERSSEAEPGGATMEESVRTLERARAIAPLDPSVDAALSQAYAGWAQATMDTSLRASRFERALELNDAAIERFPANPVFRNERAAVLVLSGRREDAIEALRQSLAVDEGFVETYLRLGALERAEGDIEEARRTYRRALSRRPRAVDVLRALASLEVSAKRPQAAVETLRRLVAIRPDDTAAHLDLALLLVARGDGDAARRHAELALANASPAERPALEATLSSVLGAR